MANIDPLENLLPSLVQCFSVIFIGYLAVKWSLITPQANAIGTYVTKFALPALFFRTMATINFQNVNWLFILAVSLGKLVLFIVTVLCTVLITKPINFGMAGILSMFITQSNDVALGYPILLSLYPDLAKYIYLFAPAQLVFINPLCFVLLEWHEYRLMMSLNDALYISPRRSVLLVLKNVVLNPLVFMTIIGVVFNLIWDHRLPLVIDRVLQILAESFSGAALFYLGMNMVGKIGTVTKKGVYVLVFLLLGKLVFLPFLTRELVVHLVNLQGQSNQSLNYSLFSFLYAGLPTAPPVFLVASSFEVLPDLMATGLVLGTFLSGPLMFITARVITMVVASKSEFDNILQSTAVNVSVISLLGCIWVLVVFILSRRCRSAIHKVTVCYIFYVILTCSGVVIGRTFLLSSTKEAGQNAGWNHYFQFALFFMGCVGTRLWTVMIAASLMIIRLRNGCHLAKNIIYFYIIGFSVPIAITSILLLFSSKQSVVNIDHLFQYGTAQLLTSVVVLTISITLTIILLIIQARERTEVYCSDSSKKLIDYEISSLIGNYNDDLEYNISSDVLSHDLESSNPIQNDEEFQINRHLTLTIILVVTMGFGIFLCMWRLIKEEISGVYIELEFLDCVFNFGQGFIVWAIFGLDTHLIVIPFKNRILKVCSNIRDFYKPPGNNLSVAVLRVKKQSAGCHIQNYKPGVVGDKRQTDKLNDMRLFAKTR